MGRACENWGRMSQVSFCDIKVQKRSNYTSGIELKRMDGQREGATEGSTGQKPLVVCSARLIRSGGGDARWVE